MTFVLLDLVPASRHQPDLFAGDNQKRQKLPPLSPSSTASTTATGAARSASACFRPTCGRAKTFAAFQCVPEAWEF
jgi:hypothetical protein